MWCLWAKLKMNANIRLQMSVEEAIWMAEI
jgi:hypothetical protein